MKNQNKSTRPASYNDGIEYIALNDNDRGSDRLDEDSLVGYVSVGLMAVLFGKSQEKIARDIVGYRRSNDRFQATRKILAKQAR